MIQQFPKGMSTIRDVPFANLHQPGLIFATDILSDTTLCYRMNDEGDKTKNKI